MSTLSLDYNTDVHAWISTMVDLHWEPALKATQLRPRTQGAVQFKNLKITFITKAFYEWAQFSIKVCGQLEIISPIHLGPQKIQITLLCISSEKDCKIASVFTWHHDTVSLI